jgi:hypothetical protein
MKYKINIINWRVLYMKKYNLNLKENEELIVDCDDLMETELVKFVELTKDLTEEDIRMFNNWVKIYKLLNYDIIDGLVINKVYKFNEYSAVIELSFRGNIEYDLLNLNPETMTVACMNVRNESVRPYIVRRLLIPSTVEEALSFAKSELPQEGINAVSKTIQELKVKGEKYDITENIKLNENTFEKYVAPEQEENKEDNKETENKEDNKETENKEENEYEQSTDERINGVLTLKAYMKKVEQENSKKSGCFNLFNRINPDGTINTDTMFHL